MLFAFEDLKVLSLNVCYMCEIVIKMGRFQKDLIAVQKYVDLGSKGQRSFFIKRHMFFQICLSNGSMFIQQYQ